MLFRKGRASVKTHLVCARSTATFHLQLLKLMRRLLLFDNDNMVVGARGNAHL